MIAAETRLNHAAQCERWREAGYNRGFFAGRDNARAALEEQRRALQLEEIKARTQLISVAGQAMQAIAQTLNGDYQTGVWQLEKPKPVDNGCSVSEPKCEAETTAKRSY